MTETESDIQVIISRPSIQIQNPRPADNISDTSANNNDCSWINHIAPLRYIHDKDSSNSDRDPFKL